MAMILNYKGVLLCLSVVLFNSATFCAQQLLEILMTSPKSKKHIELTLGYNPPTINSRVEYLEQTASHQAVRIDEVIQAAQEDCLRLARRITSLENKVSNLITEIKG
jgi:uncharacterized coiled-coil protein SlyX